MKVMVIGGGGREHALAAKIAESAGVQRVWCAPGNAGSRGIVENLPIGAEDIPAVLAAAKELQVDLVVVGPEAPLAASSTRNAKAACMPATGSQGPRGMRGWSSR